MLVCVYHRLSNQSIPSEMCRLPCRHLLKRCGFSSHRYYITDNCQVGIEFDSLLLCSLWGKLILPGAGCCVNIGSSDITSRVAIAWRYGERFSLALVIYPSCQTVKRNSLCKTSFFIIVQTHNSSHTRCTHS